MTSAQNMPTAAGAARMSAEEEWRYAEKALTWYGWGSPVGAGLFLLELGVFLLLGRFALTGLWPG